MSSKKRGSTDLSGKTFTTPGRVWTVHEAQPGDRWRVTWAHADGQPHAPGAKVEQSWPHGSVLAYVEAQDNA